MLLFLTKDFGNNYEQKAIPYADKQVYKLNKMVYPWTMDTIKIEDGAWPILWLSVASHNTDQTGL